MPRYTRMKTIFLQGVIWLCLLNLGYVLSAIEPGYLDFDNLPDTNFSCVGKVIGGYYADLETNCQMFHVCTIGQLDEPMDIRFLCLNGTVFDQETRVCERVDEVDCTKSERFYHLNLELYGNTAPPILEESEETEPPIISSTTSTTTTKRPTTTTRATRATFYTTPLPTLPSTTHSTPKVITSNQFPINSGPDIRFNPEEINIRLTPGSPPIIKSPTIKSPSVSYQQQAFNGGDARITVTTHTAVYKDEKIGTSQKSIPNLSPSTQKPKSVVSYGLTHSNQQQMYHHKPFDYNFQQTENSDVDYHTDLPSGEYSYHDDHIYDQMNYQSSVKKPQIFVSSTTKRNNNHQPSFVSSTAFPLKQQLQQSQQYSYQRTDKPPHLQLPVPLFPTLPPLTFSSPAPFTLTRHFEQKRSNDHQQRPRIIVSASASVSDASGRRLNYSLGTIGTSHLIPKAPHTYDEYKEDDVGLDPFYHDVPKVKSRQRRDLTSLPQETEGVTPQPPKTLDQIVLPPKIADLTPLPPKVVDLPPLPPKMVDLTPLPPKTVDLTPLPPKIVDLPPIPPKIADLTPLPPKIVDLPPLPRKTIDLTPLPPKTVDRPPKTVDPIEDADNSAKEDLSEETTHWTPPEYVDDNYEPLTYNVTDSTTAPENKTEIVSKLKILVENETATPEIEYEYYYEYIDDNYEPSMYNETKNTTEMLLTTTEEITEPSVQITTFSSSMEVTVTEPFQDLMVSDGTTTEIPEATTLTTEATTLTTEATTLTTEATTEATTSPTEATTSPTEATTTEQVVTNTILMDRRSDFIEVTTTEEITTLTQAETITTESTTTPLESTESTTTPEITTETPTTTTIDTTTTEIIPETTLPTTTTTNRYSFLKPRDSSFRRNPKTRPTARHRFSSPSIHLSPSVLKLGSKKATSENIENIENTENTEDSEEQSHRIRTNNILSSDSQHILTTTLSYEDAATEAPLTKSANPTEPKSKKSSAHLSTTPITKTLFIPRRFTYDLTRSFNCFGKDLNQFYEDPRDCRLFHYCTAGYTKTQVLDMKYVCDYGTYFDSDKLICTKIKPQRCKVSTTD